MLDSSSRFLDTKAQFNESNQMDVLSEVLRVVSGNGALAPECLPVV